MIVNDDGSVYALIINIRERYNHVMENKYEIDAALEAGAVKATLITNATLKRVREKLGF